MLADDHRLVALALLGSIQKDEAPSGADDELESALIVAYEDALESGVSPPDALAAALDWISNELGRRREKAG
jgi:hypothetical protein